MMGKVELRGCEKTSGQMRNELAFVMLTKR